MEFPKPDKVGTTPSPTRGTVKMAALSPVGTLIAEYIDAQTDSRVRIVDYAAETIRGECPLAKCPELMKFSPDGRHLLLLLDSYLGMFEAPWIEPLSEVELGDWKERSISVSETDNKSENTEIQLFFERLPGQSRNEYVHKDAIWLAKDSFQIAFANEAEIAVYVIATDGMMLGYRKWRIMGDISFSNPFTQIQSKRPRTLMHLLAEILLADPNWEVVESNLRMTGTNIGIRCSPSGQFVIIRNHETKAGDDTLTGVYALVYEPVDQKRREHGGSHTRKSIDFKLLHRIRLSDKIEAWQAHLTDNGDRILAWNPETQDVRLYNLEGGILDEVKNIDPDTPSR